MPHQATLQTYREYSPTQFDPRGLSLPDRQDWFVAPVGRNRDSECLAESNFASLVKALGGESDTVEIHRFGHWACGWFEIVLVHPSHEKELGELQCALASYPVLDDSDLSERETAEAQRVWDGNGLRYRIEACARARVSIFAARRDEYPYECQDYLLGH